MPIRVFVKPIWEFEMPVSMTREGEFAIVTVDHPPVNALSQAVRQGLWTMVEQLDSDDGIKAVVLICAGRTFIAGADVSEFGKPPVAPFLPDLVKRIETAQKPWIAAIHGSALGGGFEIALGCRYRVALATASVGLPEVMLGIVPGAGGTVRTPRFAGVEAALDLVTSGKPVKVVKAKALGLVDAVVDGDLLAGSLDFARSCNLSDLPPLARDRQVTAVDQAFWNEAENALAKRVRGEVAPLRALACIRAAVERDFDDALAFERETFLDLRGSKQAAALRYIFFSERAAPRPAELNGLTPRPIRSIGVIGGGTMGAGIAAACRDANLPVVLIERDHASLERGLANLAAVYDSAVKRGRMTAKQREERLHGVHGDTDYTALADVDLVIEAVFEDVAVKQAVFRQLDAVCRPDTVLATNTSYLNPDLVAQGLSHPERFLGLHFFSPAQVMKLLEIVPTPQTHPEVLATGFALARSLNKIPVRAGICDGFIGNRILKTTRAQAERVLLAGATPLQVDAAMRGFGFAMGPFEAQDLGGLDIAAFQRQAARTRGDAVFAPVAERLCALGRLGQKTKAGWYDYGEGDRQGRQSAEVEAEISAARAEAGATRESWTAEAIVDAILLPMLNEGARILAEGIAGRASDIDLVKIHGYGFPRWQGGPMHWGSAEGLKDCVRRLDLLAQRGLAETACSFLRDMAERPESGHRLFLIISKDQIKKIRPS